MCIRCVSGVESGISWTLPSECIVDEEEEEVSSVVQKEKCLEV